MKYMIIKSNRVLTPSGLKKAFILIEDDKIISVANELPTVAAQMIDAGNDVVMPGIVDTHVHINEPGRTEWEGFDTATRAALAGGITTLVEMPLNASPVTTTVNAIEKKLQAAQNEIHCNCGFWGGIIPGNENEIEPLIEKGVLGFKAFLTHSGIDEFPNVAEEDLRKVMPIIAKHHLPLLVHCELSDNNSITKGDNRSYQHYIESRPKQWEDDAVTLMIRLCEEYNCRTHIVHLSSANSIAPIAAAKQKGLSLTVETCPHYLYFNAEDIPDGRTEYKCAPPIREKENNEQLWQALKSGIIDFVVTDHSPAPPAMKEIETGDLMKAWGGIASLQFSLPVLWTAAQKHNVTLEEITKWLCEGPAQFANLKTKGKIEKGYDADLVIWSPEEKFTLEENMILHRHKITPYFHVTLSGVVKQTFLKGEIVYDNGKLLHLNKGNIIYG